LVESFMTEGVAGVVEAWGRIELHEVGFGPNSLGRSSSSSRPGT
jgi:hypothetical protein